MTMTVIIKQRQPPARQVVAVFDAAARLGADIDHSALTRAREYVARLKQVEADERSLVDVSVTEADVAARYYAGKLSAAKVATAAAGLAAGSTVHLHRIMDRAKGQADRAALAELRTIGDDALAMLRPVHERLVAKLDSIDATLPPGAIVESKTQGRAERDAWVRLVDLSADLDAVHDIADRFRTYGVVPVPDRAETVVYRWRRLELLAYTHGGQPNPRLRPAILLGSYRNGATPAMLTQGEVDTPAPTEPDPAPIEAADPAEVAA